MSANMLAHALFMAGQFHDGQLDKQGLPVIHHVRRVSAMGMTEDEQIVGALHDLIEDTEIDQLALYANNFPPRIVNAVVAISRHHGERYSDYIDRLISNPLAVRVKLHDLEDNIARGRNDPSLQPLVLRYLRAQAVLRAACT
jgi:(p)ppGpp synthase/HD superfamily hydrolase